jgi:hypothetical protein
MNTKVMSELAFYDVSFIFIDSNPNPNPITASLVLPSLYQIWMLGDAASANEVIEQLFDKSNSTHHKGLCGYFSLHMPYWL